MSWLCWCTRTQRCFFKKKCSSVLCHRPTKVPAVATCLSVSRCVIIQCCGHPTGTSYVKCVVNNVQKKHWTPVMLSLAQLCTCCLLSQVLLHTLSIKSIDQISIDNASLSWDRVLGDPITSGQLEVRQFTPCIRMCLHHRLYIKRSLELISPIYIQINTHIISICKDQMCCFNLN